MPIMKTKSPIITLVLSVICFFSTKAQQNKAVNTQQSFGFIENKGQILDQKLNWNFGLTYEIYSIAGGRAVVSLKYVILTRK